MTSDPFADQVLASVHADIDRLAGLPAGELMPAVKPLVQRLLLAREPDGSWADPHLLQEALRAYVDLVEIALDDEPAAGGLDMADRRWLDACRQAADSYPLFEDMLVDLRRDVRPPGPNPTG